MVLTASFPRTRRIRRIPRAFDRTRFDSLFRNIPTGVYRTTPSGKILLANPALVRMLGFDSFEALAQRDLEKDGTYTSYTRAAFRARLEAEGEIRGLESVWKRRDGSLLHVRENANAVRAQGGSGRILYYEGTAEDITAYRHTVAALRESEATLRGFYDSVPMLMGIVELTDPEQDESQDILFITQNAAVATLMNTTPEAMRGRRASELGMSPEAIAFWRANYQEAVRTEAPIRFETPLSPPGTPTRWYAVTLQQVTGRRFCYIAEDVTETRRLQRRVEGSLAALIVALEAKDPRTRAHSVRVARLAALLAAEFRPGEPEFAERVRVAALFHDIGKIGVSEAVLNKTTPLTPSEVAEVRRHPEIGETILRPLLDPEAVRMVRSHHEHISGEGYPDGLAGDAIPLGGRIIAVADAYDAMVSPRPYSPVRARADVLEALQAGAGVQWDAGCVSALVGLAARNHLPASTAEAALLPDLSMHATV